MKRVVILGAGITGLTAAFYGPAGAGTTVLEAAPGIGGSIVTLLENGLVLEAGPNTLRTGDAAERLLVALELQNELLVADPRSARYIVRGGRARAIVPGWGALLTSAFSIAGKLRALAEPFIARGGRDDESVERFFNRRFGSETARYAAGPIVSGIYADDPGTLSVRSAFPRLWAAEQNAGSVLRGLRSSPSTSVLPPRMVSFRSGLSRIIEALHERIVTSKGEVLVERRVTLLEGPLANGSASSPRWRITTGEGSSFEAGRVVSTIPAPELARLLGERLPRSGSHLAALESSPLAVVLLAFRPAESAGFPRGFGALIPRGEGFRSLGILYPSSLFPERTPSGVAQTTVFLGGALDPELARAPEGEILQIAEEEVRRLHPRIGERIHRRLVRWESAIPRLPLGHHATLAALEEDLAELNGAGPASFVVTGPWRDGVSLADRIGRGEAIGLEAKGLE